jgi:hypothetical protein
VADKNGKRLAPMVSQLLMLGNGVYDLTCVGATPFAKIRACFSNF